MLVNFDQLPGDARIWIYQANRDLADHETEKLSNALTDFVQKWTSHGKDLKGSYKIIYNRFIILGVDQGINDASGCSIDSSVHFLQELESSFNITLLDKSRMAFKQNGSIKSYSVNEFKEALKKGELDSETLYFNNLAQQASELETNWEVPVKDSWLTRYLNA